MVKIKTKMKVCLIGILSVTTGLQAGLATRSEVAAEETTFNVNVLESLSVTITQPSEYARGNMNTFLRNKVNLEVTTNNSQGYIASMHSSETSDLVNTESASLKIETLGTGIARSNFPVDRWGYSLDDTDAGDNSKYYYGMTADASNPIIIKQVTGAVQSGTANAKSNIFFGTKAGIGTGAGTYTNEVVISVVTGNVSPVPSNPSRPSDDTPNDNTPTYNPSNNQSVSTSTSGDSETTKVIGGEYTKPLGVTETTSYTSNVSNGASLTTGLLVASATAATSGLLFFALAKRRKNDEDEEDL